MEKPEVKNRRGRGAADTEGKGVHPPERMFVLPPLVKTPANEVKLAGVAVDLNVRLRSSDMSVVMQERALRCSRALVDAADHKNNNKPSPTHLAMCLKKEFDASYGPAWHCIVGKNFGSFVTHSAGGFIYFSIDKLSFLLFKTEVRPIVKSRPFLKISKNN